MQRKRPRKATSAVFSCLDPSGRRGPQGEAALLAAENVADAVGRTAAASKQLLQEGEVATTGRGGAGNRVEHLAVLQGVVRALRDDAVFVEVDREDLLVDEALLSMVFAVGKDHGFEPLRDWFKALYEVLLGASDGPRFGGFIALYGVTETITLIDRALAGELVA